MNYAAGALGSLAPPSYFKVTAQRRPPVAEAAGHIPHKVPLMKDSMGC